MKTTSQKSKKNQPAAQSAAIKQQGNSLKKYYYLFGLISFFLFANTLGHDYNMDDGMVTKNHKLTSQGLSAIGEIFTSPYYSDAMGYAYGYRPIVHLSFALEHELFGEKPGAGHFINVILFAFSVVLFFKLLVRWVGEKNVLFAGITTLIFAVHPIHTEVVASLKNRDEILAFLFVVWAGLSAHKFLEKERWTSLLWTFILFSLAMLSKKSVYPMAVVLPVTLLLLNNLSIKQLAALAVAFIIPAAFIGSELQTGRLALMIVLPLIIIAIVYFVKSLLPDSKKSEGSPAANWILPAFLIVLTGIASIYLSSLSLLFLVVPFAFWLLKLDFNKGMILLVFLSACLLFFPGYNTFILFSVIASIGYTIFLWKKGLDYKLWLLLSLAAVTAYITLDFHLLKPLAVAGLILFFLSIFNKFRQGLAIALLTVLVYGFLGREIINLHTLSILSFSILYLIHQKTNNNDWIRYSPLIGFMLTLSLVSYTVFQSDKNNSRELTENIQRGNPQIPADSEPSSFLKEGRTLLYAENTLVAPHTQPEKIATGFLTLGEYLRLHLFPKELSFYYGYAKIKTVDFKHPLVWVSLLFHLSLIILAVWQVKKRPVMAIGIFWYLSSILLFSNWVELVAGMVGERLAFTASAGFCIVITSILFWIKPDFSIKKPGITGTILGISILILAGRTIARNNDWKDTITLMGHDIQHLSNSAQANNLYAMSLMGASVKDRNLSSSQKLEMQRAAISHFDQATTIWPGFFNAYIDKGRATMLTKDYQEGIKALEKAIEIDPENPLPYYILLEITELSGDFSSYLKSAEQLFSITQNDHAYGVVARGYFLLNELPKSREVLLDGLKNHPDSEVLKKNLGIVEEKMK